MTLEESAGREENRLVGILSTLGLHPMLYDLVVRSIIPLNADQELHDRMAAMQMRVEARLKEMGR